MRVLTVILPYDRDIGCLFVLLLVGFIYAVHCYSNVMLFNLTPFACGGIQILFLKTMTEAVGKYS